LYDGGAAFADDKEHCFICFWAIVSALCGGTAEEAGSSNFYDFPFNGGTFVRHVGWIAAGVSLELRSRGSLLFDNLPFLLAWGS